MPTYNAFDTFVSATSAASALDGTEEVPVVQASATVKATPAQMATFVASHDSALTAIASSTAMTAAFQPLAAGVTATTQITGEYIFDEDSELDYSSSITDGMGASALTFTELPANTVAVWVFISLADTSTMVNIGTKRSSGGTQLNELEWQWADLGTNVVRGTFWLPTDGNSIYITEVHADTISTLKVLGYKVGS